MGRLRPRCRTRPTFLPRPPPLDLIPAPPPSPRAGSPACDAAGNCPTNYAPGISASTQGQCVLEEGGSGVPTLCALLCTPGTANACDAAGATCQPIQGVGLCTY